MLGRPYHEFEYILSSVVPNDGTMLVMELSPARNMDICGMSFPVPAHKVFLVHPDQENEFLNSVIKATKGAGRGVRINVSRETLESQPDLNCPAQDEYGGWITVANLENRVAAMPFVRHCRECGEPIYFGPDGPFSDFCPAHIGM